MKRGNVWKLDIEMNPPEDDSGYNYNDEVTYPAIFLGLSFLVPIIFLAVWCIIRNHKKTTSVEEAPRFVTTNRNRRKNKS